jgi:hypothetical protein
LNVSVLKIIFKYIRAQSVVSGLSVPIKFSAGAAVFPESGDIKFLEVRFLIFPVRVLCQGALDGSIYIQRREENSKLTITEEHASHNASDPPCRTRFQK